MSVYTNDTDTLRHMISQSVPQVISSIITIVSVLISMLVLSLPLTGIVLIMVAVMIMITKKIGERSAGYFKAQQKDLGAVNGFIEEMIDGHKVIKVFCHEEESEKAFDKIKMTTYFEARNQQIYLPIFSCRL